MKKFMGINRNKYNQLQMARLSDLKKKNRFKIAGKDDDDDIMADPPQTNNALITNTTQNSSHQQSESSKILQIYEYAKLNITEAYEIKKQIVVQCKKRISIFKESEAKKFDENVCRLSKKAIQYLLKAQKSLSNLRAIKGTSDQEQKYIRNMQKSLAQELCECSRQLRSQQKQHFDRLRAYETGTTNTAIQLSETQKQRMRGDFEDDQGSTMGMIEDLGDNRNAQIHQLVSSINKLSCIYKQLNQLVIQQGSLIDRIDCNIDQTLQHVQKGTEHLKKADQHASSTCAQKCMMILLALVMILAVILGLKYSN